MLELRIKKQRQERRGEALWLHKRGTERGDKRVEEERRETETWGSC